MKFPFDIHIHTFLAMSFLTIVSTYLLIILNRRKTIGLFFLAAILLILTIYTGRIVFVILAIEFVFVMKTAKTPTAKAALIALALIGNYSLFYVTPYLAVKYPVFLQIDRVDQLKEAIDGLRLSGRPLAGFLNGKFIQAEVIDDVGLYYFVPMLAYRLGMNIEAAATLFIYGLAILACLISLAGCMLCFKSTLARLLAVCYGLRLLSISRYFGDVYIAQYSAAAAVIPFALYFGSRLKKNIKPGPGLFIFACAAGLFCGTMNYIRVFSGTGAMIFLVFALLLSPTKKQISISPILLSILFFLLPTIYFNHIIQSRNEFLESKYSDFSPTTSYHQIWHNALIGLGYIKNDHDLSWDDASAGKMIEKISPGVVFGSDGYYQECRKMFFRFVDGDPVFVLSSMFSKLGVVVYFLLIFGGVGLYGLLRGGLDKYSSYAFAAGLAFSSMNGVLGIPTYFYLIGFLVFSSFYGLAALDGLLRRDAKIMEKETQ